MKNAALAPPHINQANLERNRIAASLGEEITELAARIHAATFLLLAKIRGNANVIVDENQQNSLDITFETLPPLWRGEIMDQDLAQLGMNSLE